MSCALCCLMPEGYLALRAHVSDVPCALCALLPHVPRAVRAYIPHVLHALHAPVCYVLPALRALVLHSSFTPSTLAYLLPHFFQVSHSYPTYSHASNALVSQTCFFGILDI